MKTYEIMYIIKPSSDEEIQKTANKYKSVVTNHGGDVDKVDLWGEKRLAYEIGDYDKGFYVLMTFTSSPACVQDLDRLIRIDESILRHMIISKC